MNQSLLCFQLVSSLCSIHSIDIKHELWKMIVGHECCDFNSSFNKQKYSSFYSYFRYFILYLFYFLLDFCRIFRMNSYDNCKCSFVVLLFEQSIHFVPFFTFFKKNEVQNQFFRQIWYVNGIWSNYDKIFQETISNSNKNAYIDWRFDLISKNYHCTDIDCFYCDIIQSSYCHSRSYRHYTNT